MITVSSLKASDIPEPEYASGETPVYRKRWGAIGEFLVSKGRERSNGKIYYCLRLADGFRTYDSLAALKKALQA